MILVGDVGGTKTRLALYQEENNHMIGQEMATFVSRDFTGLEEVVMSFLGERKVVVQTACFGVPGPVVNGEAQTTNLPWTLKEVNVAKITKIKKVKLVNDLVATTAAVPYLSSEDLFVLYKGKGPENKESPRGVLAPGTGLGQAFLYFCGGQYH
ncbi:MAG: glucokinase, partial [bacterium]